MIRVTCAACGKSFNAKDELAGRKGKCPSCKEPIVVPAAGGAPAPAGGPAAPRPARPGAPRAAAPAAAPAPAVTASAGGGGGSRRRSAGGSRGKGKGKRGGTDYTQFTAFAAIAVVLIGVGAFFFFQESEADPFALGIEAMQRDDLTGAVALFEQVQPGTNNYSSAQEELAKAKERLAARKAFDDEGERRSLHNYITYIEDKYVHRDGEGYKHPKYASNTRYMLKRCQEFLDRFPDDNPERKRITEIREIMNRYREVASLSTPPTEADVLAELDLRNFGQVRDFGAMVAAVDDYAARNPDRADAIDSLRQDVQRRHIEFWNTTRDELVRQYDLDGPEPRWQQIANMVATYLSCVEDVPGLSPTAESLELLKRAEAGGG